MRETTRLRPPAAVLGASGRTTPPCAAAVAAGFIVASFVPPYMQLNRAHVSCRYTRGFAGPIPRALAPAPVFCCGFCWVATGPLPKRRGQFEGPWRKRAPWTRAPTRGAETSASPPAPPPPRLRADTQAGVERRACRHAHQVRDHPRLQELQGPHKGRPLA